MGIKQEEFEAYNFVSKMVPRADGKINNYVPFWGGWALREAFEAGFNYCKQNIEKGNKCMEKIKVWVARDKDNGYTETFLYTKKPEIKKEKGVVIFIPSEKSSAVDLPVHFGLKPGQIKEGTITLK